MQEVDSVRRPVATRGAGVEEDGPFPGGCRPLAVVHGQAKQGTVLGGAVEFRQRQRHGLGPAGPEIGRYRDARGLLPHHFSERGIAVAPLIEKTQDRLVRQTVEKGDGQRNAAGRFCGLRWGGMRFGAITCR